MTDRPTNDRPTNDEREQLIVGDRAGALDADEAADVTLLADLLGDPSTWAEPRPGLEDAIVRSIVDSASAGREPAVAEATRGASEPRDRLRRRRFVVSAVAAAAAIVIAGAIAVTLRSRSSADFTAQLSATPLAPGAGASADIVHNRAGFRVTLDAHGLPALKSGEFYQAWLKNGAGSLVPIGSFSSSDGRVTLWSGVSPNDFPTLTVTIESTDNDQSSSGRRVLVGSVRAS